MYVLKIFNTFVFFLTTWGEYSKKYRKESVKYSIDVLKKKKNVLDIFYMNKKCFIKNSIETSPQEIWTRILFSWNKGIPITDYKLLRDKSCQRNFVVLYNLKNSYFLPLWQRPGRQLCLTIKSKKGFIKIRQHNLRHCLPITTTKIVIQSHTF